MIHVKNSLSEKYVFALKEVFSFNGWNIEEDEVATVFDSFCKRLELLEENEEYVNLILELTKDFLWVRSDTYEKHLKRAFSNMFSDVAWEVCKNLKKNEKIFICPIVREADFGKVKSGSYIAYLAQSLSFLILPQFHESQLRIMQSPEQLVGSSENNVFENMRAIIFVDDYIGTGETATECLSYAIDKIPKGIPVFIITIAIQEEGYNSIRKLFPDVNIYYSIIRKKGISDKYSGNMAEDKRKLMKRISKYVTNDDEYLLGYGDSEALIAMVKTPNNTFPIYWRTYKGFLAPFPRLDSVKAV